MFNILFRTKDGSIVIGQTPNASLILYVVLEIASLVTNGPRAHDLGIAAKTSLVVWSLEEVVSGVNLFRRLLGGVVLIGSIISL